MHSSDDKIVSISFDNKKFLDEVQNTIKALEQLNDAASGKHLNTSGLEQAFNNLTRTATSNIDSINRTVSDTSSYTQLANSVDETGKSFSALEIIAIGALMNIGGAVVDLGSRIASNLTRGITDGWQEYNLLVDSTQTILANTERYGTTIDDVTRSLDELNEYADLTIYNFAQMTRNMGYFTTSGMDLEAAQNMVMGMANTAALFGTANEQLQRAMYQMSQAMSAGTIRKMDWKSMQNASMGGMLLQEELIRVAALMTGKPFEEMNEWVSRMGGFYESLEQGWLTSEIFQETMRRFAGMTREEAAAIRDINGNALSDEEIDRIVTLGEKGLEAAQVVRTLKQMLEAVGESIGSGWAQSFRIIIGDLEQAKKFWSPINKIITENISAVGDYRNAIIQAWADMYRPKMLDDMNEAIRNIDAVLEAIGTGFMRAFGDPKTIGQNIGRITEALGDLSSTLEMDEEELNDIADLVEGLFSPFVLIGDIVAEFANTFFNAGISMDGFGTKTDSVVDKLKPVRKAILNIVGAFGRFLSITTQIIRDTGIIHKSFSILLSVLKFTYNTVSRIFGGIFSLLKSLWERYDITNILINFVHIANDEIIKLGNAFSSLIEELKDFFYWHAKFFESIDLDPLNDFYILLDSLGTLIKDILDPTMSLADAINNFKESLKTTSIYHAIKFIANAFRTLIDIVRNSELGPYIEKLGDIVSKVYTIFKYTIGAIILGVLKLRDIISNTNIGEYLTNIGNGFQIVFNKLKNTKFGEFISNISTNISNSLNHLSVIFKGNKVTREALSFVGDVKDALTIEGGLPKNNIISFVDDISKNINDTAGKLASGETFDRVKDVLENIKQTSKQAVSIADEIRNSNIDSVGFSYISSVFGVILDVIYAIGDKLSRVGSGIFNAVKNGLQWIADTLSLMASGERYRDLSNAQRFYDIVQMFVRVFTKIASSVLMFLTVLSVMRWASAAKAIGEGIEAFGKGIKQAFAAKKWANIASIFKTITVLVIAIMAGIFLISKFADVDKFTEVLMSVSIAVGSLLIGVSAMVLLIMGIGASIAKSSKKLGIDSAKTIKAIGGIFKSVTAILTRLMLFTYAIGKIALEASKLNDTQYAQFDDALWSMMGIFGAISGVLFVLTLAVIGLGKSIRPLEAAVAPFATNGENMLVNPIQQVLYIMKTITSQIVVLMLAMSASLGIMMFMAKDANELEKSLSIFSIIMGIIMAGVIGIIAAVAVASQNINPLGAQALNGATGQILLTVTRIALAISLMAISLSVSFAIITAAIGVLSGVVSLLDDDSRRHVMLILGGIAGFLLALISEFVLISLIAANTSPSISLGSRMLKLAGSMMLMSVAIGIIAGSLAALLLATKNIAWTKIVFVSAIIVGLFSSIGIILAAMTGLLIAYPTVRASRLVAIAGAFTIISLSLSIISASIIALGLLPVDKIVAAGIAIGVIFTVISAILLGLTYLSATTGVGGVAIGVVASSLLALSTGVLLLGTAMLQAARGVKTYAQALTIFQSLKGDRIKRNMLVVAETIPEFLRILHGQFDIINTMMIELSVTLGTGFAAAIFTALNIFNTLIIANSGAIVSTVGSALIGFIYGALLIVKEFLETIIKPGSILWDILDIIGQFLTKASEYVGYYGTVIIVKFVEGIVHGIQDLGLDTWIAQALNVVVTAVEQKVNDMFAWAERRMNSFYASANAMVIDSRLSGYQEQLDDVNRRIQETTSTFDDADPSREGTGAWQRYQELVAERQGILDNMAREQESRDNLVNYWQSEDQRIQDEVDAENQRLSEISDSVNEMLEQDRRSRHIFDNSPNESNYTGYATYIPDQYRGEAMDARKSTDSLSTGISNLGTAIRNFLGLTDGQTVGDVLMGFLGLSGGSDIFSSVGESSGSDFMSGFGNAVDANSVDMESLINTDSISDYSAFQEAFQSSTDLPEELKNPVISPVLDDSKFWSDFKTFEDTWNSKTYDQFAVDVGTSMMVREQADGDAVSDGNVSYNFTQNNYSNRDLTRTEIYRDGQNLLRGSGLFRVT